MNVLFDNDIPPRIAHAIRKLAAPEHYVVALRDMYREIARGVSVPDEKWMSEIGRSGPWTAITFDHMILKEEKTIAAWRVSGIKLLIVRPRIREYQEWDQFAWYVRAFPRITAFAERMSPGIAYHIPERGVNFKPIAVKG